MKPKFSLSNLILAVVAAGCCMGWVFEYMRNHQQIVNIEFEKDSVLINRNTEDLGIVIMNGLAIENEDGSIRAWRLKTIIDGEF